MNWIKEGFVLIKKKIRPFLVSWSLLVLYYVFNRFRLTLMEDPIFQNTLRWQDEFGFILAVAIISGLVMALYGIPVSLLSDRITQNSRFRPLWAFLVHAGFGTLPTLYLFGDLNLLQAAAYGAMWATYFWLADEFFK